MTTTEVTEVKEREEVKKEGAIGAGALILLGVILYFAFKKKEEPTGKITPAVTIGEVVAHSSPGEKGGTVRPGQTIKIVAGLDNKSTRNSDYVELPVTIRYSIHEGSWTPFAGDLLLTLTTEATLRPGITTYYDSPSYKESLRPQERRDVRVEVLYKDEVIAEKKEETLYRVKEEVFKPAVEVLSIAWM